MNLYLICVNEKLGLYQIRLESSHLVLATAYGLESAVKKLEKLVRKYEGKTDIIRSWENENYNSISEKERERRIKQYEEKGKELQEYVELAYKNAGKRKKLNFKVFAEMLGV